MKNSFFPQDDQLLSQKVVFRNNMFSFLKFDLLVFCYENCSDHTVREKLLLRLENHARTLKKSEHFLKQNIVNAGSADRKKTKQLKC